MYEQNTDKCTQEKSQCTSLSVSRVSSFRMFKTNWAKNIAVTYLDLKYFFKCKKIEFH